MDNMRPWIPDYIDLRDVNNPNFLNYCRKISAWIEHGFLNQKEYSFLKNFLLQKEKLYK